MAKKIRTPGKERPSTPPLLIHPLQNFTPPSLSIIVPPSPTNSSTTCPISPQESYTKGTETGSDTWTTPSTTPTGPFDPFKSNLPEPSPYTQAPTGIKAQADTARISSEMNTGSASADVLAIEQLQASMKIALQGLASAFEHIDKSTRLMTQLASEIHERDQLTRLRDDLEHQIKSQKEELNDLKTTLEERIQQTAEKTIKTQLDDMIQKSVERVIEEKVRTELSIQIPDELKKSGMDHQRQMLEVQTDLHNSEARRYNASLQSVSLSVPLRPLLRPVPTPEQSPYPASTLVTPAVMDSSTESTIPSFTFSGPPAPAPIQRSVSGVPSAISRSHSLQQSTSSASVLFPKDLQSLFSLDPGSTKTLLREYGLPSSVSSPQMDQSPENPAESQSHPQPQSVEGRTEEEMKDMNTLMTHIGVPFLMVPPPKSKETNADRRRKLAPLIINKSGFR